MGLYAEQAFLQWYFQWTRWSLPATYNMHFETFAKNNYTTASGQAPLVIHFNGWIERMKGKAGLGGQEWKLLCYEPRRAHFQRINEHRKGSRRQQYTRQHEAQTQSSDLLASSL